VVRSEKVDFHRADEHRTSRVSQRDQSYDRSTNESRYQRLSRKALREVSSQAESIGDVMMENLDPVRLARVVAGAVVLAGLAASIASCSGNGANPPSTTQSPTTTTTTTQSPAPGAPPPAPTEKSISPTGGNLFTPTVRAPVAPTAIPGNRENTG
jgi:hypothetical protein